GGEERIAEFGPWRRDSGKTIGEGIEPGGASLHRFRDGGGLWAARERREHERCEGVALAEESVVGRAPRSVGTLSANEEVNAGAGIAADGEDEQCGAGAEGAPSDAMVSRPAAVGVLSRPDGERGFGFPILPFFSALGLERFGEREVAEVFFSAVVAEAGDEL